MTPEMYRALAVMALTYGAFVAIGAFGMWREDRTRRLVFSNLDSAAENGYFEPGEHCHGMSPDDIAYDMTLYASDCESLRPETLAPYVRQWGQRRGFTWT